MRSDDQSELPQGQVIAPSWVNIILKQIDVLSIHLSEQHKRLQQEIYVRLTARSSLLNYSIVSTGGLAGIVSFMLPRGEPSTILTQNNMVVFAIVSVVCFTGAFVYLFFYMNFLSHSGYIYAASRQITEELPRVLNEIQGLCDRACQECGMPDDLFQYVAARKIFSWERHITEARKAVRFTDSKFEILGFSFLSVVSFSLSMGSFAAFVFLLMERNGVLAMITALGSGIVFMVFIYLYSTAFLRCRTTYDRIMKYRDAEFPAAGVQ